MFSTADTIVAIATPPGPGGLGVVRLSGASARAIAARLTTRSAPLEARVATFTRVEVDGVSDQAVVTWFPAPRSYTGEDVVELSVHGSPVVLRAAVSAAIAAGARLAERGEFTLRAFLNGQIDLAQAEAVADLVNAVTPLQARAAFDQLQGTLTEEIGAIDRALFDLVVKLEASVDFPDEGYHFVEPGAVADAIDEIRARVARLVESGRRGRLVREGLHVAIVGPPNVGKSSLFNALVGASRAIVTEVPGTTRDLVTEVIDLEGLRITLVDTAGLRDAGDIVEAEGVRRSRGAATIADLVLVVIDGSRRQPDLDLVLQTVDNKRLVVLNKSDLGRELDVESAVRVSAVTGMGLDGLRSRIIDELGMGVMAADRPAITNVRHVDLMERAHAALGRALDAVRLGGGSLPEEFVLADLQEARAAVEEITGRRTSDDVLARIFSTFCIGK